MLGWPRRRGTSPGGFPEVYSPAIMAKIPNIVHFVFGLRQQWEPFHLMYYLAIESARQVLKPDRIIMHCHRLPYGMYWDLAREHLELHRVEPVDALEQVDYSAGHVPEQYRYAHHADFIRLDALIEHGGIYADIDTLFLKSFPDHLYRQPFVIGREADVRDELDGSSRPSLCNALMMAEPGAEFARHWRAEMLSAMNGSWSNHSCLLARELADRMPEAVHIEPEASFMGIPLNQNGLADFLERDGLDLSEAFSVHWWEHLWWEEQRQDFSSCSARKLTLETLQQGSSTLARLAKPFLPDFDLDALCGLPAEKVHGQ
ncbi:MAG: glycosyltransferase [Congregibacter sp.]